MDKIKVRCKWEFDRYSGCRNCIFDKKNIGYEKCNEKYEVDWVTFLIHKDKFSVVKS